MAKFIQTVMFVLLFGVALGCHSDNKASILGQAEACMETNPDSAFRMLQEMEMHSFDFDYQKAKYALLWTQAQHKCRLPLGDDSLINVAVDYFVRHKNVRYAAKAFLYKGLVHKQCKEVEKAAEAFAKSEQWFEGVEDDQYKALLYNHYGMLMSAQANYEDALAYLKNAYAYYQKGDSIHYVMSACGVVANTYELIGNMDSAKAYFEKGMQYRDRISSRRYYLYMKDYANFQRKNGEYDKAEQMLLECEQYITDEQRFSLYSTLATLYYEMKEYCKALAYAEKVVMSEDSVVVRGGFFNLYRIHRQLGNVSESQRFHDLYRVYDNDITLRLKTAEVAVVPYEVKTEALEVANQKGKRIQWRLAISLLGVVLASGVLYVFVRKRHRKQQQELHNQLAEDEIEICEMTLAQSEKDKEIGLLHYQMERKREQMGKMEQRQKERLQRERDKVKEKNEEIEQLKEAENIIRREKQELERVLAYSQKEQREMQAELDKVEHDKKIEQRIALYRMNGKVENIATLLIQLKYGGTHVEMPIAETDYLPMLMALIDAELPGMRQQIDALTNNTTKRVMCYLIVLGLDDMTIMFRITGKREDTIKRYYRECRELVSKAKNTSTVGMDDDKKNLS